MSKYNLQDILNEYVGGSRHGTIKISYRDLQDAMDTIERQGDFVVRELPGPSGDGKTNREFEVVFIGAARGDNKQEEAGNNEEVTRLRKQEGTIIRNKTNKNKNKNKKKD